MSASLVVRVVSASLLVRFVSASCCLPVTASFHDGRHPGLVEGLVLLEQCS